MKVKEFRRTIDDTVMDAVENNEDINITLQLKDLVCNIPLGADEYECTLGYLDEIICLMDDEESAVDRLHKENRELKEKLQNRNEAIKRLCEQIDGLKNALHILMNVKTEDKTPEGIRLSVGDFSTVYEAMFCNGDYRTEDGWQLDQGIDLKEEHDYGHDVHLAWHGFWCNLQDGASVYNYVINNLPELAEEIDD